MRLPRHFSLTITGDTQKAIERWNVDDGNALLHACSRLFLGDTVAPSAFEAHGAKLSLNGPQQPPPAGDPRRQRVLIDLAVQVLRAAMVASDKRPVDTVEVRLALRCLLPHCPERWPLESFWESAGVAHDIGRAQGVTAAFNGIVRQLRLAKRYPE